MAIPKTTCCHNTCERKIMRTSIHTKNYSHTNYCSIYCATANEQCIDNHKSIIVECAKCGGDTKLTYAYKNSNRKFCSPQCFDAIRKRKNGHRDFTILTILKDKGELTSSEISYHLRNFKTKLTPIAISRIFALWISKGVVSKEYSHKVSTYRYISDLRCGAAITEYSRINGD